MINQYLSWFEFDGENSQHFGLVVSQKNTLGSAEKNFETIQIAGRNGDLIKDNGTFSNMKISYDVGFLKQNPLVGSSMDFVTATSRIKNWLFGKNGYKKLIDSEDTSFFRLAYCSSNLNFEQERGLLTTSIEFDCKPFKYAFDGEKIITLAEPKTIINTNIITALPYVKIYGNGDIDLYVGGQHFLIKDVENEIEIDSEKMLVYKLNNGVYESKTSKYYSSDFPKLKHGENIISWSGNVTKIELKPRWCSL